MTPKALSVYKEQKEQEDKSRLALADMSAWMNGVYVLRAIGCVMDKNATYPNSNVFFNDEPELTEEEKEEIIKENTQIAASNFAAWAEVANKSQK